MTLIRTRVAALPPASGQASAERILEEATGTCLLESVQAFVFVRGSNAGCQDDGACRQFGAEQQVCSMPPPSRFCPGFFLDMTCILDWG